MAGSGTGPADFGVLGVVDAGGIPPAGGQEDGDAGVIGEDSVIPQPGTGSHSVAVYSGTCKSPARASQVYVPIRSTTVANTKASTICSTYVPGGTAANDVLGCVAVYTAQTSCGGP